MESFKIDTRGVEYEVAKSPVPRLGRNNAPRTDRETGWTQFVVELVAYRGENEGAETLAVTLASPSLPVLAWRSAVEVVGLVAFPWAQVKMDDRGQPQLSQGVAYRAQAIRPLLADLDSAEDVVLVDASA